MPRGTRVERCVRKVKKSGRGVNPYAVCQASTKQSYATGKKLESTMKYYLTSKGQELLEVRTARGGPIPPVNRSGADKPQRQLQTDKKLRGHGEDHVKGGTQGQDIPPLSDEEYNEKIRQANIQKHEREAKAYREKKKKK